MLIQIYYVQLFQLKREIVNAVINIPLFLSYPGQLNTMQYWSENHQVETLNNKKGWHFVKSISLN